MAAYAASQTERLEFMIAHRPGIWSPTAAARAFATLDHTNRGYDPYYDTIDYGRWIISAVREEAARRLRQAA